jgi:hypothetical protein
VTAINLPVTETDFRSVETNLNPVLHAITGGRPFKKTLEAHAAIYFLGRVDINANV